MDEAEADGVEQYTEETRRLLEAATTSLGALLRQYTAEAGTMLGGSSETRALFEPNRALDRAVREWNDRAFAHTGTFPLRLRDDDGFDEDEESDEDPVEVQAEISVVSRWDLVVLSVEDLVGAGRSAHRRTWPQDTEEDANVAIAEPSNALYAILYEAGEPWFEIPGVEVVSGFRVYIAPSGPLQMTDDLDIEDQKAGVDAPEGAVLFGESW